MAGLIFSDCLDEVGIKLLPKLRPGADPEVGTDLSVTLDATVARNLEAELREARAEVGLAEFARIERE